MASPPVAIESTILQAEDEWIRQSCGFYACPKCKRALEPRPGSLYCPACALSYPVLDGIPDFIAQDLEHSTSHDLRYIAKRDGTRLLNFLISNYETYIYPPVCNLFGGWHSTSLQDRQPASILDVACGPGTYGRRLASTSRAIYGIDISLSMLRQGVLYVERDGLPNVRFARAMVEALPFPSGLFDAAICAGSLNHFPDTVLALREIHRTMKAGAPLAVMCFVTSNRGLLKHKFMRDRVERNGGHVFALPDLERYVAEAGFEGLHHRLYGAIVVLSARKKAAET